VSVTNAPGKGGSERHSIALERRISAKGKHVQIPFEKLLLPLADEPA
jgi:hypothetical protein